MTRLLILVTLMLAIQLNARSQVSISDSILLKPLPNAYGQIIDPSKNVESGLVMIFTNHACNYSQLYIDRLNVLSEQMKPRGIRIVAIESKISSLENTSNSLDEYFRNQKLSFDYLIDLDNEVARSFNAQSSPHVFLLIKKEAGFQIVYDGSIDNNSRKPERVTKQYLRDAIEQLLSGEEIRYPKTKSIGCNLSTN